MRALLVKDDVNFDMSARDVEGRELEGEVVVIDIWVPMVGPAVRPSMVGGFDTRLQFFAVNPGLARRYFSYKSRLIYTR